MAQAQRRRHQGYAPAARRSAAWRSGTASACAALRLRGEASSAALPTEQRRAEEADAGGGRAHLSARWRERESGFWLHEGRGRDSR